jgi:hypothetical protein
LLKGTYDTFDEAKNILQKNFAYTDQLLEFKDRISLGWKGVLTTVSFTNDIWPVLEQGKQELGEKIADDLQDIYES